MNRRAFLTTAIASAATAAATSTALAGNYGYRKPTYARKRRWRVVNVHSYDWLNVRSGPSTRWTVIGRLENHESGIRVIKFAKNGRWAKIVSPSGYRGWVASRYITDYWA